MGTQKTLTIARVKLTPNKNQECNITIFNRLREDFPFVARYINRTPDPDWCVILSIDYENKRAVISNGACRYSPSFDEIKIYTLKEFYQIIENNS